MMNAFGKIMGRARLLAKLGLYWWGDVASQWGANASTASSLPSVVRLKGLNLSVFQAPHGQRLQPSVIIFPGAAPSEVVAKWQERLNWLGFASVAPVTAPADIDSDVSRRVALQTEQSLRIMGWLTWQRWVDKRRIVLLTLDDGWDAAIRLAGEYGIDSPSVFVLPKRALDLPAAPKRLPESVIWLVDLHATGRGVRKIVNWRDDGIAAGLHPYSLNLLWVEGDDPDLASWRVLEPMLRYQYRPAGNQPVAETSSRPME